MAKQDNTTDAREAATRAFVEVAFDDAYIIREELYGNVEDGTPGLFGRRAANREQLRSLASQGHLTEEQLAELEELYPAREAVRRSDEERAAELEAKAAEVRRKAAEKAAKDAQAAESAQEPANA